MAAVQQMAQAAQAKKRGSGGYSPQRLTAEVHWIYKQFAEGKHALVQISGHKDQDQRL
jgi:hypothetical protein